MFELWEGYIHGIRKLFLNPRKSISFILINNDNNEKACNTLRSTVLKA